MARHVIGCHVTQERRVQYVLIDTWQATGLADLARHIIEYHSTKETRIQNACRCVAAAICVPLMPGELLHLHQGLRLFCCLPRKASWLRGGYRWGKHTWQRPTKGMWMKLTALISKMALTAGVYNCYPFQLNLSLFVIDPAYVIPAGTEVKLKRECKANVRPWFTAPAPVFMNSISRNCWRSTTCASAATVWRWML